MDRGADVYLLVNIRTSVLHRMQDIRLISSAVSGRAPDKNGRPGRVTSCGPKAQRPFPAACHTRTGMVTPSRAMARCTAGRSSVRRACLLQAG